MKIIRKDDRAVKAPPAEYFSGAVQMDRMLDAPEPARVQVVHVAFEPGGRTAWHTHPLGQTLVITEGRGLVQRWGEAVVEVAAGDVVWFEPGEKHWHGATETSAMAHIAIQEKLDGNAADWMEHVEVGG